MVFFLVEYKENIPAILWEVFTQLYFMQFHFDLGIKNFKFTCMMNENLLGFSFVLQLYFILLYLTYLAPFFV